MNSSSVIKHENMDFLIRSKYELAKYRRSNIENKKLTELKNKISVKNDHINQARD